jgi:hypothetical protein
MLLFYEDEPDTTMERQPSCSAKMCHNYSIDPLPQYGSHAFIPYLPNPQQSNMSSSPISDTSTQTQDQNPLTIHAPSSWTYCGPLLHPSSTSLPPSFHTWSTLTVSSPSALLQRLLPLLSWLHLFLEQTGIQHYWLTIRCTKSTHEYDTPRWHTDDNFFTYDPSAPGLGFSQTSANRCWKLCTTLLGPSTLFIKKNEDALRILRTTKQTNKEKMGKHTCTSIRCLGCSTYADSKRESLAESLSGAETEAPSLEEVAFFRLGEGEGAVHSEPKCDTDRIFINVIPGKEEDLRALMGKWSIGFPRAWCFGMPVGFVVSDEAESLGGVGRFSEDL